MNSTPEKKKLGTFFVALWHLIVEFRRPIILLLAIIILSFATINGGYFVASSNPKSCLVCHYMQPHYDSWKNSAHSGTACIECHPGRRTLIDGYMLRYITGTYHTKLQPDVKADACLKCHTETTLTGTIEYKRGIKFNHEHHLGQLRRGKKLRCTSCHATGKSNEHFTVDTEACYLCHFKDADKGRAFTSCTVCHGIPQGMVEHQGFSFDHSTYTNAGVECSSCHTSVASGNGDVPKNKCYECHEQRSELANDVNAVHRTHITEHGIDCFKCHDQIEHGKIQMASAFELDCNKCHKPEHAQTVQMYIGSGGQGVAGSPSTMFLARVSCEACHSGEVPSLTTWQEKKAACVRCHGAGFDTMLEDWKTNTDRLTTQVKAISEQAINLGRKLPESRVDELVALMNLKENSKLLIEGKAIHNPNFAIALTRQIVSEASVINRYFGGTTVSPPDLLAKPEASCKMCHNSMPFKEQIPFEGRSFSHNLHTKELELACTTCHVGEKHPPKTIDKKACKECHE